MHSCVHKLWRPAAVALAGLAFTTCGGGKDPGTPSAPSTPVPTATPVAAPTPDPPVSASCAKLPPGNTTTYTCRTEGATFQDELDEAIEIVRSEHPEAFDGNRVVNVGLYIVETIKAFDRMGICADYDGEELGVATTHDFNDQFDILTAKSEVRRYFVGSCWPSVVPVDRSPRGGAPASCTLPPSREIACGDPEEPAFYGDVSSAVGELLETRPELFDFTDLNRGTDWPRVKDMPAYHQAVIDLLVKKGYCALFDGEEIQVKRTNQFSEHYDVNYADKYIRTGGGTFRGSCHPAAF
jgi:hypothetical protein